MSSYVDTTISSAEELQEDEELIEAVEALTKKTAETVHREIVNDWNDAVSKVLEVAYWCFPFLLQPKELIQDDLKKVLATLVMFVAVFLIMEPSRNLYNGGSGAGKKKRSNNIARRLLFGGMQRSESWSDGLSSDEASKSGDSAASVGLDSSPNHSFFDQEQTDEERFEQQLWPSISMSRYRKLVLPPTCRLVAKEKRAGAVAAAKAVVATASAGKKKRSGKGDDVATTPVRTGNSKKRQTSTTTGDRSRDDFDDADVEENDNPAQRLKHYLLWFLYFVRSIVSYDYARAGWTIIQWMQGIRRHRRVVGSGGRHRRSLSGDDGEQEDNNDSDEQQEEEANEDEGETQHSSRRITERYGPNDLNDIIEKDEEIERTTTDATTAPVTEVGEAIDDDDEDGDEGRDTVPVTSEIHLKKDGGEGDGVSPLENVLLQQADYCSSDAMSKTAPTIPLQLDRSTSDGSVYYDLTNEPDHQLHLSQSRSQSPAYGGVGGNMTISKRPKSPHSALIHRLSLRRNSDGRRKSSPELAGLLASSSLDNPRSKRVRPRAISASTPPPASRYDPEPAAPSSPLSGDDLSAHEGEFAATVDRSGSEQYYFSSVQYQQPALANLSTNVPLPDKNGYILGDELLPVSDNSGRSAHTPLLVFVNSRSGPQQGHLLITQMKRLLNPIQVWDLADGGPEPILESFLVFSRLRILVCGGDGTVSWIVSTLDKIFSDRKKKANEGDSVVAAPTPRRPPIAILPLGTGNDLARIHGWGGGYSNESLTSILEQISESYISLLDRWEVTIEGKNSKKTQVKTFFNYLGVGADAQAALQVHYLRESKPEWFFSRIINKAWYGVFGAEDLIMASCVNVRKEVKLIADGVEVPLPADSQGIIVMNIDSYAGGVPLWSHGTLPPTRNTGNRPSPFRSPFRRSRSMNALGLQRLDSSEDLQTVFSDDEDMFSRVTACDRPSSCQDGLLEIVSIRGAFHLGQIKVGLSNAQRLCQCREAKITIRNKVAVQVDGEPWRQRPCTLTIRRMTDPAVMLHRSADDGGVETEMSKLLDWAEERRYIDSEVHAVLMKEFSRRIESKTRKRRIHERDNMLHTLKKAISQSAMASSIPASSSSGDEWQGGVYY